MQATFYLTFVVNKCYWVYERVIYCHICACTKRHLGKITGDEGVLLSKFRKALTDPPTEAEIRVAKALRKQVKDVYFLDENLGHANKTGTFDLSVNRVATEVKRIKAFFRFRRFNLIHLIRGFLN